MAPQAPVLIAGGYGVFGGLLARELIAESPGGVLIAGRNGRRAARFCGELGRERAAPMELDLRDRDQVALAARRCSVFVCAAGPFQSLPEALPSIAVEQGAHWLDIADAPGWLRGVLGDPVLDQEARTRGVCVVPGLSSVPALAGLLASWCAGRAGRLRSARTTLFIGHRNRKGGGSIGSLLDSGLGRSRMVDLPLGRRRAWDIGGWEPALLGLGPEVATEFHVGFELGAARAILGLGRRLARIVGPARAGRILAAAAAPFDRMGADIGCLQVDVLDVDGRSVRAALIGRGQKLAVLPAVLAAQAIREGRITQRGVLHPTRWLEEARWLELLRERGIQLIAGGD